MTIHLSSHFTLEELTRSDVALRKGIDNTPNAEIVANLTELAATLERVRKTLGCPLYISSGYRSPKLNAVVSKSLTSAHLSGYAADFTAPQFGSPKEICREIIDSGVAFDQLIYEGNWVHLSIDPRLRNMIMTARFSGGEATYTYGI